MSQSAVLRTERVVPFKPSEVFAAIEDGAKIVRWWGPNGFTSTSEEFDFRKGGRWIVTLHGPDGANYPNEYLFKEIQKDAKVVFEHVIGHWFQLTITLTPEGDGTRLAWEQEFPTPEEADRLRSLCEPANEQNLDRLESVLKRSQA
ncbi:polyketide cyclase [bacterium]|nr:MAG: polyketide cyclase [bacterium]